MKKLLGFVMVGLLAASGSAFAKSVTFDFSVLSSGSDIYACNAGLRHRKRGTRTCRFVPGAGQICTNDTPGTISGDQRGDYMRVSLDRWDGYRAYRYATNRVYNGYTGTRYRQIYGRTDYGQLDRWDLRYFSPFMIRDLTFNFSSERFGAEFFIDICYRGTQIQLDDVYTSFVAKAWVQLNDLRNTSAGSYRGQSGLRVSSRMVCYHGDRSSSASGRILGNSAPLPGSGVARTFAPQVLNQGRGGHPRRCVMRFYFDESRYYAMRPHQLQSANVRVYGEITNENSPQ